MEAKRILNKTARQESGEEKSYQTLDWVRVSRACSMSDIGRSTMYENFDISGGAIETASIRKPGATRGIRLVNVPSLIAWLNSHAEQPSDETETERFPGLAENAAPTDQSSKNPLAQ